MAATPQVSPASADDPSHGARRAALGVIAEAPLALLEATVAAHGGGEGFIALRRPEVGLVMLRGRIGGGGRPFNLGEATVTRAAVRDGEGRVGLATILGRHPRRALLAAICDALWQAAPSAIDEELLAPARAQRADDDQRVAEETAATRVDFFTLVRGDD